MNNIKFINYISPDKAVYIREFPEREVINKFDGTRIRSRSDEIRYRIEKLEFIVKKYYNYFELIKIKNNLESNPLLEYLRWVYDHLKAIDNEDPILENDSYIEYEIEQFETSLVKFINEFKQRRILGNNDRGRDNKIGLNYGLFFEKGMKVFINVVDVYDLWLPKERLSNIIKMKKPEPLSFAFISLLARFIVHPKDHNYKELYFGNMKKAKLSLIQSYSKPTIECIIALGFLAFNNLANFEFDQAIQHFVTAMKMIQTFSYDDGIIKFTDTKKEDLNRLWKALSLLYLSLRIVSPDLSFRFSPNIFNIQMPKNHVNKDSIIETLSESDYLPYIRKVELHTTDYGNAFTEIFVCITSHIQKVYLEYPNNYKSKFIPPSKFNLPEDSFKEVLSKLNYLKKVFPLGEEIERTLKSSDIDIVFSENMVNSLPFKKQLKFIIHILYIILYYPQVLVYPKPIKLSYNIIKKIYYSANVVFIYYFVIHGSKLNTIQNEYGDYRFETKVNHLFPHFILTIYPIYTYLNIISQVDTSSELISIVENCKVKVLSIMHLLYSASKLKDNMQKADSYWALRWIAHTIHRFDLPDKFNQSVKVYLEGIQ